MIKENQPFFTRERLKKSAIVLALIVLVFLLFSFVVLKFWSLGDDKNYFNQNLRETLAQNKMVRKILSLHYDGDARADYLGSKYKKIFIEVDVMDNYAVRLRALDKLSGEISRATRKKVSYLISDRTIPFARTITSKEIETIAKQYRNHKSGFDTVLLHFLYMSRDEENPTLLGTTFRDDTIVLFGQSIKDVSDANEEAFVNYEASTALHEFGHQLGLPHNFEPGCIMNEAVEIGSTRFLDADKIRTEFCDLEFSQLDAR
jgi:hypothetical protein